MTKYGPKKKSHRVVTMSLIDHADAIDRVMLTEGCSVQEAVRQMIAAGLAMWPADELNRLQRRRAYNEARQQITREVTVFLRGLLARFEADDKLIADEIAPLESMPQAEGASP